MNRDTYCHIITNLEKIGGAEGMLLRLINFSEDKEVLLISLMHVDDSIVNQLPQNVKLVSLGANNAFSMLMSTFKLKHLLPNYSNVYCWMYHANVIGAFAKILKLGRIRLFWGVRHSLDDYQGESFSTKVAIQVGRLFGRIPNKVIYCSQRSQKQHEAFGYSGKDKSVYIPNGYTFPKCVERSFSIASLTFGAAGRFHEAKDYNTLIKAISPILEKTPEAKLKICGRDVTEQNIQFVKMIEQAGINKQQIDLQGEVIDMEKFYNNIDIFILSSKTEGFPNVLAEAASHGCAVFSTDVGDASIIVNNSEHIVPVADSNALTQAIENYISLPSDQRKYIASSTKQYVRSQFSISHIAEQFFALGK